MLDCPMCRKWDDEPEMRIARLEHCHVSLNRDQFFQGYCFVYTRDHLTELFHLDLRTRSGVIEEMNSVAAALFRLFSPAKINYELLGNMVPHMHWHIVPRFATDPLWPRPIWSEQHEPVALAASEYAARISLIRNELGVS
jgi:diadenosine tetraphosphate (Ap4A) HIT family hydrolase